MSTGQQIEAAPCLNDVGAERAVIAAILTGGADAMLDIEEILTTNDFYGRHHGRIFTILKHLVHDKSATAFDIPTIIATAKMLGFDQLIGKNKDEEYLASLFSESVGLDNARSLAAVVWKLSTGRQAYQCTRSIQKDLKDLNGSESIEEILKMIEEPVFDFTGKIVSQDNQLVTIGDNFDEIIGALAADPKDIIGLPTGFQLFDHAIGGGLRPGGITVVGARPKVGKSFYCLNVSYNIAQTKIPVLYLDTELPQKWQLLRLASLISGVKLDRIETGQFASQPDESSAVYGARQSIQALPLTHYSIAGQSVDNSLSIVRRWLAKYVGFLPNGKAKPCVILYDYLKLMDGGDIRNNLAEYQVLGLLLTKMHNFALQYDIPILATVQVNREGTNKDAGDVISGSDRILWLASSFTLLRKKTPDEMTDDPASNGDRVLKVTDTRFGAGMEPGEYINVKSDLSKARMTEGKTFSQQLKANKKKDKKKSDEAV